MRQRNLLIITVLLLTLLTGGWGSVIAAAFCAHNAEQQPTAMAEDHDCCPAKLEQPPEHCAAAAKASAHASHEAMAMDEMEAMPSVAEHAAQMSVAHGQPTGACLHCVSRGGLATTFVVAREPEQKKREASLAPPPALEPDVSLAVIYTPSLSARQHAPPGTRARRHLVLNIFVI